MKGAPLVAKRLLRSVGMYNGNPRLLNVDTGAYSIGYTEVNVQATTAFSRTKMHQLWVSGDTDIQDGSRVQDMVDGHKYIVMSVKTEYTSGSVAFVNGTLMYVDTTCTISRVSSNMDAFGRCSDSSFTPVYEDVWLMINPMSTTLVDFLDTEATKDKIKVAVQDSVNIRINDRISTAQGENYIVESISKAELRNVTMLHVVPDNR